MVNGYFHIHLMYHLYVFKRSIFQQNNRDIARYCFGQFIQNELDQFLEEWNSHRIRPSKKADAPAGIPNVMYHFPSLTGKSIIIAVIIIRNAGTFNHAMSINDQTLDVVEDEFNCICENFVPKEFFLLAEIVRTFYGLPRPITFESAFDLFWLLLEFFNE